MIIYYKFMYSFDVLCVGNVTIDIFLSIEEANEHVRLNDQKELIFKSGDKISINNYKVSLGGNASNVAIGMARMGHSPSLIAETGYDEFLGKIQKTLDLEGVDRSLLVRGDRIESAMGIIINYFGDRTIFSEDVERPHKFSFSNISAKLIYLSSLGKDWQTPYKGVIEFLNQTQSILAFNPGSHQLDDGSDLLLQMIKHSDYLFVNKEEAKKILKTEGLEVKDLLSKLHALGSKNVIITDGPKGAHLLNERGEYYHAGVLETKVVERTGAGDAFASGFLSAVMYNLDSRTCLSWGIINSASVIGKVGAIDGLLRKEEIKRIARS
ncbi:MAG: carbohydrate kinase family protein [Candidatus Levybacteria bacterium]|nr:carbohydrate kinase family protein [Candidatus Levybacteria bacterium]